MEIVAAIVVAGPAALLALLLIVARLMRRTPAAAPAPDLQSARAMATATVRNHHDHDDRPARRLVHHAGMAARRCRTDSRDHASLA